MPPVSRRLMHGLPPVIGAGARVLILGSFPSRRSLDAGEYYANKRNQFWEVMGSLTGTDPALPYNERLACLVSRGIALWDAIGSCRREGSADSRIESPSGNPIRDLLASHPGIRLIACNGSASARLVQGLDLPVTIPVLRLPSTSPAYARLSLNGKIREWSVIRAYLKN